MRIVLVLLLLLVSVPARANTIYSYTGDPFTDVLDPPFPPGTFDTSMRVTGWFELAGPLPADLPLTDIGGDVLAFSFSNGRSTLTDADPSLTTFFFVQTNAAGGIDVWDIILQQSLVLTPLGDHDTKIVTQNDSTGQLGLSGVQDLGALLMCDPALVPRGLCRSFEDSAFIDGSPGVWGSSSPSTAVPEPATAGLMAFALGAARLAARRRAARRP